MTATKLKVKKGDTVVVIAGSDKGKTGEILKVFTAENRVLVQGVNQAKRHTKPTQLSAGGIETIEKPIHVSNVAHIDPKTKKPTRIGYKIAADGTKSRIARKSGQALDKGSQ
jgi:large subunit ribosomal protein L24